MVGLSHAAILSSPRYLLPQLSHFFLQSSSVDATVATLISLLSPVGLWHTALTTIAMVKGIATGASMSAASRLNSNACWLMQMSQARLSIQLGRAVLLCCACLLLHACAC